MTDLLVALALMLAIEGLAFAAFPKAMRRAMAEASELPDQAVRTIGLISALVGVLAVALVRGSLF